MSPQLEIDPLYSERTLATALARGMFDEQLVIVDGPVWPEYECDLLVITRNCRAIDVEIKISRADLRADRRKGKWYGTEPWRPGLPDDAADGRRRRDWPKGIWKHYYAVAAPIWKPELLADCGEASGVLLVDLARRGPTKYARGVEVVRRARPNRHAKPLTPDDIVTVARLASLRMWDAYDALEKLEREKRKPESSREPEPGAQAPRR